ncbi:hypothetical protein D3C83_189710 [compost metagenome]
MPSTWARLTSLSLIRLRTAARSFFSIASASADFVAADAGAQSSARKTKPALQARPHVREFDSSFEFTGVDYTFSG